MPKPRYMPDTTMRSIPWADWGTTAPIRNCAQNNPNSAIASLVETILDRCPDVRILATSREALALPGEVQLLVTPLPVTEPDAPPEEVRKVASVRLFLDRARAVRPDLGDDDESLGAVSIICRRLDGIPLAIELAAARINVLSPEQIAARLDDRFQLLDGGDRFGLPKYRTLRARSSP